jgi:hypothetical protein
MHTHGAHHQSDLRAGSLQQLARQTKTRPRTRQGATSLTHCINNTTKSGSRQASAAAATTSITPAKAGQPPRSKVWESKQQHGSQGKHTRKQSTHTQPTAFSLCTKSSCKSASWALTDNGLLCFPHSAADCRFQVLSVPHILTKPWCQTAKQSCTTQAGQASLTQPPSPS